MKISLFLSMLALSTQALAFSYFEHDYCKTGKGSEQYGFTSQRGNMSSFGLNYFPPNSDALYNAGADQWWVYMGQFKFDSASHVYLGNMETITSVDIIGEFDALVLTKKNGQTLKVKCVKEKPE